MSAKATFQFLDTNILVYAHDNSAGAKRDEALSLLSELVAGGAIAVSVQVLQELFVTLTRKPPQPLDGGFARESVADLSHVRVHAPGPEAVRPRSTCTGSSASRSGTR